MDIRSVEIDGRKIEYTVNYKNSKYIRMMFQEGKIIVNTSSYFSDQQINDFVVKNKRFVFKHLDHYLPKYDYQDNGFVYIYGKCYNIVLNNQRTKLVKMHGNDIFVFHQNIEKTINDYLKRELYKYASEKMYHYVKTYFNCEVPTLEIKKYKSRWGTYYQKEHKISLNIALIHFEKEVIDSVIMHELVHTLVMDHSKTFYDELYARMPDYKKRDKKLKELGL